MINKIAFGTGGVRGIMGDGEGFINHQTIKKVTHGLAKVILSSDAPKRVGVAHDTRFNSKEFAQTVCEVMSAFCIDVYFFDKPMPTPVLSHAIQIMDLGWGVCITASHNPQEYNGYKVYDRYGVQVTDRIAAEITGSINSIDINGTIPEKQNEYINKFDEKITEAYFEQIISFVQPEKEQSEYPFIYSALHGAGANAVPTVLKRLKFSPICIQQNPDGAFGGLKTPNPEEPVVYEKALAEAEKVNAMFLLATDPDCDRVGVMVKTEKGFEPVNGNQIGALLIDYIAQTRGISKGDTVISTIVSGLLGEHVAKGYGLEFERLLTGFKYIGERITNLPQDRKFFFGYEESYGFLAGDGARDKDAVIASALIIKMAEHYSKKGMTLIDRLSELSKKYGYCLESLYSANVPQDIQRKIMNKIRSGISIDGVTKITDYDRGVDSLPQADVVKLLFESNGEINCINAWAAIRPSGTEPKLKIYTGVHTKTYEDAKAALEILTENIIAELGV